MAASVQWDISEAGRRLAVEARRELKSLPAAERQRLEDILFSNRDGLGRRGELYTPTGSGRYR